MYEDAGGAVQCCVWYKEQNLFLIACTGFIGFTEHGKASLLVASDPVEVKAAEPQQQATFDSAALVLGPALVRG